MKRIILATLSLSLFLIPVWGLGAQTGEEAIGQALAAYEAGSFENALAIISAGVSETEADEPVRRAAAKALTSVSISEYDKRNYRNAYEGFRKSLMLSPTNAKATSYYVTMRKEMDVSSLANSDDVIATDVVVDAVPADVIAAILEPEGPVHDAPVAVLLEEQSPLPAAAISLGNAISDPLIDPTKARAASNRTRWLPIIAFICLLLTGVLAALFLASRSRSVQQKESP